MDLANFDTKTVDAVSKPGFIILKDKGLKKKCEAAERIRSLSQDFEGSCAKRQV